MIRTDKRLRLCTALLAVNLAFIWGNSLMPGEISGAFSDWVKEILAMLLPGTVSGVTTGGGLLRKIAHFSEFAALGMCLTWLVGMLSKHPALALGGGFAAACVDETIQLFVPGRHGSPVDVGIDTTGVAVGVALLWLGHRLRRK